MQGEISTVVTAAKELECTMPGYQKELAHLRETETRLRERGFQLREERLLRLRKSDCNVRMLVSR